MSRSFDDSAFWGIKGPAQKGWAPNLRNKEDVDDLKDSLKILERKISRSDTGAAAKEQTDES